MACAIVAGALISLIAMSPQRSSRIERTAAVPHMRWDTLILPAVGRSVGEPAVYPYSVIPGGITTVAELKSAMKSDPLIASHFQSVDFTTLRMIRAANPRSVYVSYRIGNSIYWTKHRVTVPQGETLFTDGTRTMRTRCGNDISDTAQAPTQTHGPLNFEMNAAIAGTGPFAFPVPELWADGTQFQPEDLGAPLLSSGAPLSPDGPVDNRAPSGLPVPFGYAGGYASAYGGGSANKPQVAAAPPNGVSSEVPVSEPSALLQLIAGAAAIMLLVVWQRFGRGTTVQGSVK